jgi:hypothetical protein
MFVRLVKRWNGYRVGKTISPQDGVAELLIKRGIAVPVVEQATVAGGQERAVGIRQRHKGRQ